jgi:hypothetical protein
MNAADAARAQAQLTALQQEFPHFVIWREDTAGRVRYVACRLSPGTHPHTVVAADPDEIRAALAGGGRSARQARAG